MVDTVFGNRLGGRLNYEARSVYEPLSVQSGNTHHQRLQSMMDAESEAMLAAGGDAQGQLTKAIEQMKKDMQGGGEETTLAESPWKGPLDPEGEID